MPIKRFRFVHFSGHSTWNQSVLERLVFGVKSLGTDNIRKFRFLSSFLCISLKPKSGGSIISGCDGPSERISFFEETLLQPIAQPSYIKDTTDFINFIEKTKSGKNTILVAMDVSRLYTNIPPEEGIEIRRNSVQDVPRQWSSDTHTLP